MTPTEKASKLVSYYLPFCNDNLTDAKYCALIALDEILESLGYKSLSDSPYTTLEARQYYVAVKQELANI